MPRRGNGRADQASASSAKVAARQLSEEEIASAVVDCGVYEGGERLGGRIELEAALEKAAACTAGFAWIGLHDPSSQVVEAVGEHFDLHPLAVEDAVHAHQRPKLDTFGDSLLLVLKTARYVDHEELVEIGEILVFAGSNFVVTVRHGEGSPLHEVRTDLEAHPDLLGLGPSSVVYAVADRVVDDYLPVIDGFATDIEEVEAEVFSGRGSQSGRAHLPAQARGARVQARGEPVACADAAPDRPPDGACPSTRGRPTTSATSRTTSSATPSASRALTRS